MRKKVSAVAARQRLGEILEGVYYRGDEVAIERAGKTMAILIPVERYEAIERSRERILAFIERAQQHNEDVPYEVIQEDVEAAIREVRGLGGDRDVHKAK